jgi:putative aldouronate transport system substrate-binding protein
MKKLKKVLALAMTAALCAGTFSSCKASTDNSSSSTSSAPVKVVMACISFNNIPTDLTEIDTALNKLLEKDNITVDLQLYGPADYQTKCNLALESGTQLDLFLPLNFANVVAKKQALAMDDLLDKYAKDSKTILTKDFGTDAFKSTTMNGHIYGMPVNKGMSIPYEFIYDSTLLKETGFTADDVNSLEDLPKIFDAVKAKHSDVICFAPLNVNPSDTMVMGLLKGLDKIDYLTDTTGAGVVVGDSGKVVDLYETDIFKNAVNMMRSWYNKGYFSKDIATTTTNATDLFKAGRAFCTLGGYSGNQVGTLFTTMTGREMGAKRLSNFYFDTQACQLAWCISSTSKHPDAAMKLLNETMTNKELLNTMLYGIEGEDYVKVDDDHVKYPDGKTAASVSYTAQLCSGVLGSESLQYMLEGTDASDRDLKIKENKSTPRSPYFGFTFDQSNVKTEISALTNVYNQYYSGLVCGSVDPTTTIPKFVQALNDAGMQTIIKEKQTQLDKWISDQK